MQHASCTVALNGDITYTVFKPDVTVAEIALLKAIHGEGAVSDIQPTFMDKRPHADERERLTHEYGAAKDHKDEPLIKQLFPGLSALPATFKDIGLDIEGNEPVEEEKPRRGRKPAVESEADPVD
jgi:hypothetical protein